MIKALFIAFALTASGGVGIVYAQAATPAPTQASPSDAAAAPAAPAGNAATTRGASDGKKSNANVEVKREELGQKLLKRKMELDNNDRPNIQPAQAPDRAREKQVAPADNKGQKK